MVWNRLASPPPRTSEVLLCGDPRSLLGGRRVPLVLPPRPSELRLLLELGRSGRGGLPSDQLAVVESLWSSYIRARLLRERLRLGLPPN